MIPHFHASIFPHGTPIALTSRLSFKVEQIGFRGRTDRLVISKRPGG